MAYVQARGLLARSAFLAILVAACSGSASSPTASPPPAAPSPTPTSTPVAEPTPVRQTEQEALQAEADAAYERYANPAAHCSGVLNRCW